MDISGFPSGITVPPVLCCKCDLTFVSFSFRESKVEKRKGKGREEAPDFLVCSRQMPLIPSSKEPVHTPLPGTGTGRHKQMKQLLGTP